jgi:hypothetical protein
VELDGNDAALGALGIIKLDARLAVDERANLAADGDDFVVVPLARFDGVLAAFRP